MARPCWFSEVFAFLFLTSLAGLAGFVRRQDLQTSTSLSQLRQGLRLAWFVASVLLTTKTATGAQTGAAWAAVGAGIAVAVANGWEYSNRMYAEHVEFAKTKRLLAAAMHGLQHAKLRSVVVQMPLSLRSMRRSVSSARQLAPPRPRPRPQPRLRPSDSYIATPMPPAASVHSLPVAQPVVVASGFQQWYRNNIQMEYE